MLARPSIVAALAVVLASGSFGRPAAADEPTPQALAEARERFKTGLSAEVAGSYTKALATFKEVALVKSTPHVRFHIGVCEEKLGDYVQALGSYRLALIEAQRERATDVQEAAEDALASLEPRLPKLTLERGAGAQSAVATLDGVEVSAVSIGAPIAVNPGPHIVNASAPGRESISIELTLAARDARTLVLVLSEQKREVSGAVPGAATASPPVRSNANVPASGSSATRPVDQMTSRSPLVRAE